MKCWCVAYIKNKADKYHTLDWIKANNFDEALKKFREKFPQNRIILIEDFPMTDINNCE